MSWGLGFVIDIPRKGEATTTWVQGPLTAEQEQAWKRFVLACLRHFVGKLAAEVHHDAAHEGQGHEEPLLEHQPAHLGGLGVSGHGVDHEPHEGDE
jgi:predicted HD phosphohydrolase